MVQKRAELVKLMHKFVQPSHVGISDNERTRATSLDPKLMFWGVLDLSIAAQTSVKSGRTGVINAQVRATTSRRIFLQQMYPTHAVGPQTHVLGHFGSFHFWMKFGAKRAKLVQ
jgi:hypothetical protein